MASAHCICPEFVSKNISDDENSFAIFFSALLNSQDQIVVDSCENLFLEYMISVKSDELSFSTLKVWIQLLTKQEKNGKLLRVDNIKNTSSYDLVVETIKLAPTTFDKCILTSNNNNYCTYIDELKKQRISLLNAHNIPKLQNGGLMVDKLSFEELSVDLAWMLHRLARTNNKGVSEDDYNDHIRNLLLARKYNVKDQTREGLSSSGKSAGELDLVIEDNNNSIFTIIEAMKLTTLDKSYIDKHYKKLLLNYNPLGIKKSFLVTYYNGNDFSSWWGKYFKHIEGINISDFNLEFKTTTTEAHKDEYSALKKLTQYIYMGEEVRTCVHYAIHI